jgi:hypothetical protein
MANRATTDDIRLAELRDRVTAVGKRLDDLGRHL